MQIKELADYWSGQVKYYIEELHNLADIQQKNEKNWNFDEKQKHQEMVDRYQKKYLYISETLKKLEVRNESSSEASRD